MPTLEELFRSRQLASQGGQTAEEAYDIRNSKKIRISSADPLVSTVGMLPAKGARALFGIRGSESFLEEEVTGLRIIRAGSIPFIYGTELPRITLRTTEALSQMKLVTSGELSDMGALGGKVLSAVNSVKSKLGLPTLATPTYVVSKLSNKLEYNPDLPHLRMIQLGKIKDSAAGSLLGQLLKQIGGGNLKTLGKQALGGAIKLGKQAIRKKLFGDGKRSGLEIKGNVLIDGSVSGFTKTSSDWFGRYYVDYGFKTDGTVLGPVGNNPEVGVGGLTYSSVVKPQAETAEERRDLSLKQQLDLTPIVFTSEPDRIPKFSKNGEAFEYSRDEFMETKRGMFTTSDKINRAGVFSGESNQTDKLDELDFVPLKFYSVPLNKTVQFRATLSGLNETFSPSWDSAKFIGSPFSYYTYSGIERSVSFNFKVFALDAYEHKVGWDKLNFLTGLVYPQGYYDSSAIKPPFIKFTLGDMFKAKSGFIESLSYTYDDATPWQISDKEKTQLPNTVSAAAKLLGNENPTNVDMKGYRLPMITDVAVTIKFIDSKSSTSGRKFYTFTPQTS